MRLAIDASTLVAEALRPLGLELLRHTRLELIVATDAWDETLYELPKRVALFGQHKQLGAELVADLRDETIAALTTIVTVVPQNVTAEWMDEATWRIPRDPRDAPTVAVALAFDCGIWTNDGDFFGCGLPVWKTQTLRRYLETMTSPT